MKRRFYHSGRQGGRRAWLAALVLLVALGGTAPWVRSEPFIDPAFTTVWDRTDRPVAGHQVTRSWMWGPAPGPAKREAYAEGAGGVRVVQYFDKGRMEVNNPDADPDSPFYVTSGLLAVELISGQIQTGNNRFEPRIPAAIPVAGDREDGAAPTYASFQAVSTVPTADHPAAAATGQAVNTQIDRTGKVAPLPAEQATYNVTYAYYEPLTRHNVADVFWQVLNGRGKVLVEGKVVTAAIFQPWFALTGLPISEAYWARVRIAGNATDVLIQAFERRIMTFTPANAPNFQVEMGNIGLHYLEWRYGIGAPPTVPPSPTPQFGPLPVPDLVITAIVTGKSGLDLNEQQVTIVSHNSTAVDFTGWRLISPKNDHVEVYRFPAGYTLAPNATVVVHAGQGYDSATDLYMRRVTWLFDATGYDGVSLYDAYNREVARYYLSGGAPPTGVPAPTATTPAEPPTATTEPLPGEETPTPTEEPPPGEETPTPTEEPPPGEETPTETATPEDGEATPTETPEDGEATPTETVVPGATATRTPTATVVVPGATPTPTIKPSPTGGPCPPECTPTFTPTVTQTPGLSRPGGGP